MMKSRLLLSFFLSLFLCFNVLAETVTVTVSGGKYDEYDGWTFSKNEDGTVSLISVPSTFDPTGGVLTIPASLTINGSTVTVSGVVGNGASANVSTGDGTFMGNSKIKAVVFPESLTTIGSSAFRWCSAIEELDFSACKNLETIGDNAFQGCSKVETVNLPEGLTTIGASAFTNCTALKTVTFPSSLTTIGSNAFQQDANLQNFTLPEGLLSIGSYAFEQCKGLTSVTIPSTVKTIGQYSFQYCYDLATIEIVDSTDPDNQKRVIETGAFYQAGITTITIPGSITKVCSKAFDCCKNLKTVIIADGVDEIESNAFSTNDALITVEFLAVTNPPIIEDDAFTTWKVELGQVDISIPDEAEYTLTIKINGKDVTYDKNGKVTSLDHTSLASEPVAFFSLSGAKVASPVPGSIVIALFPDGSARKLLVK